ncbi:hypothetical protein NliqN6_4210 [Naganishia liquefaciens]|uniref:ATP binding protein n=1 Tax=Naganishia liquefaciens TaxID=104408 RepID=A0A8H3TVF3_9TREE|nr:hypothetical protein NliqN6_4210 [Naganishia liquefaciens]
MSATPSVARAVEHHPVVASTARGSTAPASVSGESSSQRHTSAFSPYQKDLDVSPLTNLAKETLLETLTDIQGQKTLVLDKALSGPLGLVTDVALLKNQAVDKMFWLEAGPLSVNTRHIVWLCRPKKQFMQIIADQIKAHQQADTQPSASNAQAEHSDPGHQHHTYTILCTPRKTSLCRRVLEDLGVSGDVELREYRLEWIGMENDLLSLELESVAKDIYLNGDDTPLFHASQALMTFQRAFGLFPRIVGKGDAAKRLYDLMNKHRQSDPALYGDLEISNQVDSLIIIDRSVDWVTPMCTQLTFEGLLDEYVGVKNAHIEVDPALLSGNQADTTSSSSTSGADSLARVNVPSKKRKHRLSGTTDKVFADIRDLNFASVGARLSKIAKRLEGDYEARKGLKNVKEMKDFVGKLGGLQNEHQALRLHTGLSEVLMPITRSEEFTKLLEIQQNIVAGYDLSSQLEAIENLMNQEVPAMLVLRAAVLLHLAQGGIRQKVLENFKREFLQTYGYHHLPLLIALETLNLLSKSPSHTTFPQLRKPLRLLVDEVDDMNPNDVSYVYSGYAPLSVRLVQCVSMKPAVLATAVTTANKLTQSGPEREGSGDRVNSEGLPKAHAIVGWRGFEETVRSIPGATFDEVQKPEHGAVSNNTSREGGTTMVFFLGGCTYTEIAALRWMGNQTRGRRYLIGTTDIMNGSSLLKQFGLENPQELKTNRQ